MRQPLRSTTALVCLAAVSLVKPAMAETMQCFNGAIDAAEIDPPTREDVARRCGEPVEKENGEWVYHKSQFEYRLSFDNEGKLYLIQRDHRQ
jgi:hypothetical protein